MGERLPMVDYEFYVDQYLGSTIPENGFSGVAARAQRYLEKLKRVCRVEASGETAEKMAICAIAESLWRNRNSGVASASVGSVSVRYDSDKAALRRELYEKAAIYLDIYRGVG